MSKKYYRGEINLFYFFLVSLLIHFSFFLVRQYNIKGELNLNPQASSAPISVQVRSNTFKLPKPSSEPSVASVPPQPKEVVKEVKPEIEKKKEVKKEDFESKIRDKKKKEKKVEKKIEKQEKIAPPKKDTPVEKNTAPTKESSANSLPKNIPTDKNSDQDFLSGNFSIGQDGNIVASSADGIDYHILKQVEPEYPLLAKKVRYSKEVIIKVKFLVGLNGKIEDIKIIKSHNKLGFDKSVIDALNQWEFKPIYYKNKNIKVYFTKDFIFKNNN